MTEASFLEYMCHVVAPHKNASMSMPFLIHLATRKKQDIDMMLWFNRPH